MSNFYIEKEKAKEKIFDVLLEYAIACYVEDLANELEKENDMHEHIPFPVELDKKIKMLINQYYRKAKIKSIWEITKKVFPRIVAVFFAIFLFFTIGVISSEAFRVKLLNFLVQIEKEYTSIDIRNSDFESSNLDYSNIPSNWGEIYVPEHVPEGFKIVNTKNLSDVKIIHYEDDNKRFIVFEQSKSEKSNIRVDTENAAVQEVKINDAKGLLVEKNGLITIVWHNNDLSFSLMSRIDKEELLKMAESIKEK